MIRTVLLLLATRLVLAADAPPVKAAASPVPATKSVSETPVLGYTKEFSPVTYKPEDCLQKNNYDSCQKLLGRKKAENKLQEALTLAKKSCEIKAEGCIDLVSLATGLGPDAVNNLKKFLEDQCVKFAEACNEVSSIYESQKDYPNAIDFARKYYLKYQKGNFTKFSYLYGDKNEAFAASLNECTQNNADCVKYMSMMTDHPQMAKMMTLAEEDCKKRPAGDSCVVVGLSYNKKAKYLKSAEFWGLGCQNKNAEACIYEMGSMGIDPTEQLAAFEKFCAISVGMPIAVQNIKKMNCQSPGSKTIPNQLKAYSEYELRKAEKPAAK